MRRALLCMSLTLVLGAVQLKAQTGDAAQSQIAKLEQQWADVYVKGDASAIPTYEAADIISTDPTGQVTTRDQDVQEIKNGNLKFASMQLSDVKVRMYGDTAVATGVNTLKGTYKGQDISGTYRFTDTWVNQGGKWQCVASQATKILQP